MEYSIPAIERLLRNYPFISEDIKKLEDELRDLAIYRNELADTLKATAPTGMPPSGQQSDPTLQATIAIIDIKDKEINRIYLRLKRLYDDQAVVKHWMSILNREENAIIELRYFKGLQWFRVSMESNYSVRQCHYLQQRAIKILVGAN